MNKRSNIISFLLLLIEDILFYPKLRKFLSGRLRNARFIIDVGANKGQSIDFFRSISKHAKIYSFEPNPELSRFLYNKYENDPNIMIRNEGVSSVNGYLDFHINQLDLTSSFQILNHESLYLKQKAKVLGYATENIVKNILKVPVITLGDFIRNENLGPIDLIKIDTEGHEYECLLGLFKKNEEGNLFCAKRIQIENHEDDMYLNQVSFEEINRLLNKNDYQLEKKIKHPFGNFYELIYIHNHDCPNKV